MLTHFEARFEGARQFAIENRVLLLKSQSGVDIDLALGALPFEELAIERAILCDFAGASLLICTAEDLIIMKAFANRSRDWGDIEGVALRQKGKLDLGYIREQIRILAKSKPGEPIQEKLETLLLT